MGIITKASQNAAILSSSLIGMGRKNDADYMAVRGMKEVLIQSSIGMEVVIGEGEMDEAPMLFVGERLGAGEIMCDIAVDPLEGTNLCADNKPNSMTTIAVGEKGSLLKSPDCYMEKIASGTVFEDGVIHIDATMKENLKNISIYKKKSISELNVILLERERNKEKVAEIRALGARVSLIPDGDIFGILNTTTFGSSLDLYCGSGGAPEGVLAACALKAVNGRMMGRLILETEDQKTRALSYGIKAGEILTLNDMVKSNVIFALSGVTKGELVNGIVMKNGFQVVESLIFSYIDGVASIVKMQNSVSKI